MQNRRSYPRNRLAVSEGAGSTEGEWRDKMTPHCWQPRAAVAVADSGTAWNRLELPGTAWNCLELHGTAWRRAPCQRR